MLQRIRESLVLFLIVLLPFHALLVTVLTRVIAGPGHAPLGVLAVWKEVILGVILLVAIVEILRSITNHRSPITTLDILDTLILLLILTSVYLLSAHHPMSLKQYLFGFKYDFLPLIAFIILRRVAWSAAFIDRAFYALLVVGGIVAAWGFISLYLPQEFFTLLGYSNLHSLYLPESPLAAFQQIGGTGIRRMQSTMSGPNQLGLWLLIPFAVALTRKRVIGDWSLVIGLLILVALLFTFSRSAWIGAFVIVAVVLHRRFSRKQFVRFSLTVLAGAAVLGIGLQGIAPGILSRAASTSDHLSRPLAAIRMIMAHPLGMGLGSAGPASNRVSDACVYLAAEADASWAADREDLCVFLGDDQVQPLNFICKCPLLPENWYLQIGVEMGVLGLALFLALTVLLIVRTFGSTPGLMLLGVAVAALFLHAWEDSAVSLTVYCLLAGSSLCLRNGNRHPS